MIRSLSTLSLLVLACASAASLGCDKQPSQPDPQASSAQPLTAEGPHRGAPPPEAFDACNGKSAGDACTVKHGDRESNGSCTSPPPGSEDSRLSCRPAAPPDGSGGPPPGGPHGGPPPGRPDGPRPPASGN